MEGAPNHGHQLVKRASMAKVRTKDAIARKFAANFKIAGVGNSPDVTSAAPLQSTTTTTQTSPTTTSQAPMTSTPANTGGMTSGY